MLVAYQYVIMQHKTRNSILLVSQFLHISLSASQLLNANFQNNVRTNTTFLVNFWKF